MRCLAYLTDSPFEPDLLARLVTIVFIDIVGSTPHIQRVGDREWSASLDEFQAALDLALAHHRGWLAGSAGDGFFLAFESPRRALRFTLGMTATADALGLPIRAGIHAGECHSEGSELRGLAVHARARIMDQADRGEVVASSVMRELLAAEPIEFRSIGPRTLRGVPGVWELYSIRAASR